MANAYWQILLKKISDWSGPAIGDISYLNGMSHDLVYNGSGNFKASIPMKDEFASIINSGDCGILTYRKGVPVWSGPIWGDDGDYSQRKINFTAVGWLEALDRRQITNPSTLTSAIYNNVTDASIAYSLINLVDAENPSWPLPVTVGTATGTFQNRSRKYDLYQKLGTALRDLATLEAGFDIFIDPVTRAVNLRAWNLFVDRPEAIFTRFGDGTGFKEDWSRYTNSLIVTGAPGTTPALVEDASAQALYGLYQDQKQLSDVKDTNILAAYGNAELAVLKRGTPLVARPPFDYSIKPIPYVTGEGGMPAFMDEWQLGDKCYATIGQPGDAYSVEKQAVRPFSISLSLDGNEKVNSLGLTPVS